MSNDALSRPWFRFGLRWLLAVATGCAILINLALAQPTKEFTSIVRLLIAAGLFVAMTFYLISQCQGTTAWHRWAARSAWVAAGWGIFVVLGTSSYLLGSALYHILESP